MPELKIMKGDQYAIWVDIQIKERENDENTRPLTPSDVEDLELILGKNSKTYKDGGVTFDESKDMWLYWFSQKESFDFKQTEPFYIRPVFAGKTIKGYFAGYIQVADTSTRRILE